jgi:hypothetical protein
MARCGGSPPKYTWDAFTCDAETDKAPNLLSAKFTDSGRQIRVKLEATASQSAFKVHPIDVARSLTCQHVVANSETAGNICVLMLGKIHTVPLSP